MFSFQVVTHGALTIAESTSILRYIGQLPGEVNLYFRTNKWVFLIYFFYILRSTLLHLFFVAGGEPWYGGLDLKDKIKVRKLPIEPIAFELSTFQVDEFLDFWQSTLNPAALALVQNVLMYKLFFRYFSAILHYNKN